VSNNSSFFRYSSKPYISGDTFRNLSKHIHDETKLVNPKNVNENDIVFLKTDFIESYFSNIHPQISFNYNLITHNSDISVTNKLIELKDDKIKNWFIQNLDAPATNTIHPLPIGLENRRYFNNGKISLYKRAQIKNKDKYILSAFNTFSNPKERSELNKITKNNPLVNKLDASFQNDYVSELASHKYALCPAGNGLDSHRIWESLILGVIPIVKESYFSKNLNNMGIPMVLLKNWGELRNLTLDKLEGNYSQTLESVELQKFSSFDFWNKFITEKLKLSLT
jgi:hypothetical protein